MELDRAVLRDVHEGLGRELQHVGHDADVGIERAHRGFRLGAAQAGEGEDPQALALGIQAQRVRLGARLLGLAEDAGDGVAAGDEGIQDGLAEFLLADEGDAGDVRSPWGSQRRRK
jgi:hypothetical protein